MPDHNHDLLFGANVPPNAHAHQAVGSIADMADNLGLDIIGFQDHSKRGAA